MIILRFKSSEEHEDLLRKVKKMKKFAEELEYCLEDNMEDTADYRGGYRKEDMEDFESRSGRYRSYRGGR